MHGSTQKTWFDKKMPGSIQKCPTQTQHASVDFAIIKHPAPSLLKSFSNFIQAFFF